MSVCSLELCHSFLKHFMKLNKETDSWLCYGMSPVWASKIAMKTKGNRQTELPGTSILLCIHYASAWLFVDKSLLLLRTHLIGKPQYGLLVSSRNRLARPELVWHLCAYRFGKCVIWISYDIFAELLSEDPCTIFLLTYFYLRKKKCKT